MKTVALYARVSSETQAKQATVASQIAMLQERVQADGHIVLPSDLYVDEGFSGATLLRPALERLRDRAADGGIDVLYVHNPDRLARRYAYQVFINTRLSNGAIEGLNGKVRTITRRAYGFHSAASLISFIFLCCAGLTLHPVFKSP